MPCPARSPARKGTSSSSSTAAPAPRQASPRPGWPRWSRPPSPSTVADVATVGLLVHHVHGDAWRLAREAAAWLEERGHEVRLPDDDAALTGLAALASDDSSFAKGLDLAVSLGGDGTMLRTVDLVADG